MADKDTNTIPFAQDKEKHLILQLMWQSCVHFIYRSTIDQRVVGRINCY